MQYFEQNQCKNISLYRAEYKAVCKEKVIVIEDHFFLDFTSNTELLYKDIASVEKIGNSVILHNKELELKEAEPRAYFENAKDTQDFHKSINDRLNSK